jgi:Putative beta-barrel porin-2, OmpL-like. bbp2
MDLKPQRVLGTLVGGCLCLAISAGAQTPTTTDTTPNPSSTTATAPAEQKAPDAAPAPTPLPTPSVTGPLQWLPPALVDAGPVGKMSVNGIASGMGMLQGNHVPGDSLHQAALTNGQIFLQKPDGKFQYFIQAGAYNLPSLATPFLATDKTLTNFFGPVPQAFVKLQVAKSTSVQIGALPTLIGAEYTFTFENMNVDRGLLWNQENAVNRGIQINQTMGKFTASFSWNDGFYSNRYSWLTGSLNYTKGPHSITFVGGGNTSQTKFQTAATPLQNNGSIYNVIYTFTKGPWILQPYVQYTNIPTNASIGVVKGASTTGGAVLASYAFKRGFSLPVRWEYITSTGTTAQQAVNLIFGPGSGGTSVTVTPTFQKGGFFARGEYSFVHAIDYTPGNVFGPTGTNQNQPRVLAEIGFIFGNNLGGK